MGDTARLIAQHRATIRALSQDGGPLSTTSRHSTLFNPDWFVRVGGQALPRNSRRELHDRLVSEYLERYPNVKQDRRAIVLAGPPGAGKSTTLRDEILVESPDEWLVIDADEFKRLLLAEAISDGSYESFLKPIEIADLESAGEQFFPLELASLVHEESAVLAQRLRDRAVRDRLNIVLDTVLNWEPHAQELGRELDAAGYSIEVVDVEVPYEVAESRIAQRWEDAYSAALGGNDALGGRWVPSEYARSVYRDDGRSGPEIHAEALARDCEAVSRLRRYRTPNESTGRSLDVEYTRERRGAPLRRTT